MSNQSTALASSPPANGHLADEPPPYGENEPPRAVMAAPSQLFSQGERSQATQIEQARAVAEVQAAIVVAQNRPRDMDRALDEMRKVCSIEMMADRAFSSFPKGGSTVSMGSIHLARELARIWGNISYGSKELARNDARGESEMMAYAWDLQTNARPETTFIVPHFIDLSGGRKKKLTDARSIYENNANMAARRMRVQIFAVIPRWFTDEAEDLCRRTLENGGGKPFKERLSTAMAALKSINVTPAMVEKKFGCAMTALTSAHLADLRIIYRSVKNGELEVDEAFPETPAADLDAHLAAKAANTGPDKGTLPPGPPAATDPAQGQGKPGHPFNTAELIKRIETVASAALLTKLIADNAEDIDLLRTDDAEQYGQVQAAIDKRKAWFAR